MCSEYPHTFIIFQNIWWEWCFRIPAHLHLQAERSECGGTWQVSRPWIWILQNVFSLELLEFEFKFGFCKMSSTWGASLRLVWRRTMQMSLGTGINFHMEGWQNNIIWNRYYEKKYSWLWSLRDGKKINLEDGRVEIVSDGKTRKLIFKVGKNNDHRESDDYNLCCTAGYPPRGCRRNQLQDKQGFFLLSAQSRMWVEIGATIIKYKLKEKPI